MAWYVWVLIAFAVIYVLFGIASWRRYQRYQERQARIEKHGWGRWNWSQDGWVRKCKLCSAVQYGGDDYDGGPDASGNVEA